MTTAVAIEDRSVEREYIRDAEGQFADVPGVPNALDKLNLAGRIDLKPGEELASSRRIRSGQWDVLAAEIDTPAGREVRLGVIDPSDRGKWTAGPDANRSARLAQLDHQMAAMVQAGGAGAADTGEFERLREERDSLAGDSEALNRTTSLTPAQAGRLRSDIEAGITKARAMIARDERPNGGEFASGVVPGGLDGDVDWRLDDAGNGGADDWVMWLAIRPHGEGNDWLPEGDDTAQFDASNTKAFMKALNELSEISRSPESFNRYDLGVRSMPLSRALEAYAVMSPSPAVQLMLYARTLEMAADSFMRKGHLIHVERGRGGKFASKASSTVGDVVDATQKMAHGFDGRDSMPGKPSVSQIRKRADKLLSDMPTDKAGRDRVHAEVGGLTLDADRAEADARKATLDKLRAMRDNPKSGDSQRVMDLLAPMKHAELDQVAKELGIGPLKGTKAQKQQRLERDLVGAKLDRDAIMNVKMYEPPPATQEEADAYFRDRPKPLSAFGQIAASHKAMLDADRQKALAKKAAAAAKPRKNQRQSTEDRIANLNAIAGGENIWAKLRQAHEDEGPTPQEPIRPMAPRLPRGQAPARKPKASERPDRTEQMNAIAGGEDIWGKLRAGHEEDARRAALHPRVASAIDALQPMVDNPRSGDREKTDQILAKLTSKQLDEVAKHHGFDVSYARNVQEKRDRLRENLVGAKLNSKAIRGGGWEDEGAMAAKFEQQQTIAQRLRAQGGKVTDSFGNVHSSGSRGPKA